MSHLTIYGATYYSYVYARCLSAAVWDKLLARDPLCPDAGVCRAKSQATAHVCHAVLQQCSRRSHTAHT